MTSKETIFRCAVVTCGFETPDGPTLNDHMITQHTEVRLVIKNKRGEFIQVLKKAGEK